MQQNELTLEDGPVCGLRFEGDELSTRGGLADFQPRTSAQLTQPLVIPISSVSRSLSDELRDYLEAEVFQSRYFLVRLACTFEPGPAERIDRARIGVKLERGDGGESDKPIAWSLDPQQVYDSSEDTRKVVFGPKFALLTASIEASRTGKKREYRVRAQGIQASQVFWMFEATDNEPISGEFLLKMVVRTPLGLTGFGTTSLEATVNKRRFALLVAKREISDAFRRFQFVS